MISQHQIRAREAQVLDQLSAIPFEYLPSIPAHSGRFLPRNLDAVRSFIAWSEAQLKEILPTAFFPPSPGEP